MIECVCVCDNDMEGPDWDEEEGEELFQTWDEPATVEHQCVECRQTIPVGQVHERAWGVWDGREATFYTCAPCARIRSDFCCECTPFGMLWDTLRDAFRDLRGSDDLEWLVP